MAQESSVWNRLTRLLEQEPALAQQCQAAGNLEEALKLMQATGARLGIALGWTELAEAVQERAGSALEDGALEQVAAGTGVSDNLTSLLTVLSTYGNAWLIPGRP